jgi:SAM-dependent methyltransferase
VNFGESYARAYDSLYVKKDYAAESLFVLQRLAKFSPTSVRNVVDLGCGTGQHDVEFAKAGFEVTGLDLSNDMVALANQRRDAAGPVLKKRLTFLQGDARSVRLDYKVDAVVALFHVMSYMAREGDFEAALRSARFHLKSSGIFMFDFWHGPAVIADPPERRERLAVADDVRIKRITTPDWDADKQIVHIRYDIEKTNIASNVVEVDTETHVLRYFFETEIKAMLSQTGFELVEFAEWLTQGVPTPKSFGVYAVARAI